MSDHAIMGCSKRDRCQKVNRSFSKWKGLMNISLLIKAIWTKDVTPLLKVSAKSRIQPPADHRENILNFLTLNNLKKINKDNLYFIYIIFITYALINYS